MEATIELMSNHVANFYRFTEFADFGEWQAPLLKLATQYGLRGTTLLAPEGINGTMGGSQIDVEGFLAFIRSDERFATMQAKWMAVEVVPFRRLKIRLKREIVTLKRPVNPAERTGIRITPADWNDYIAQPGVTLIDVRNDYEVSEGKFNGAVDPATESFSEFPQFVAEHLDPTRHRKVAMYCTGGIRCEKASAYLLAQGFETVAQLDGGILAYQAAVAPDESQFKGKNFVFDDRRAV